MGILDRFKSKKEQEIAGDVAAAPKKAEKAAGKPSAKGVSPKATSKALPENLVNVITAPLVTEKAATIAHAGQYSFVVSMDATRVDVRNAVKAMYGVTPTSVNIMRVRGKVVRFGGREGMRSTWKKAVVTLPKGKTIDVYEGV
ncbi:50S ribosomal protein L23 [Patescibacteria group bacterium]|nr:MAG: 50S ribosomal protein L23 [Patescibacteria group bacterium]